MTYFRLPGMNETDIGNVQFSVSSPSYSPALDFIPGSPAPLPNLSVSDVSVAEGTALG